MGSKNTLVYCTVYLRGLVNTFIGLSIVVWLIWCYTTSITMVILVVLLLLDVGIIMARCSGSMFIILGVLLC